MKILMGAVAGIALTVGGLYAFNAYIYSEKQADETVVPVVVEEEQKTQPGKLDASGIEWSVEADTTVILWVDGVAYPMGEAEGCGADFATPLEPMQVSRFVCWFAGGGTEFAVFQEGGERVAKKRWIQESGGPEVNAETEGPWEAVATLNINDECPAGSARVGEGCMPLKDECEMRGDQYYFDQVTEECLTR